MTDISSEGLPEVFGNMVGISSPVRSSFFKAASDLLGALTAIPAAKLKQYAQGIEDTTAARSAIAASLSRRLAEEGGNDPLLLHAAAEVYTPGLLRKAKNRIQVAQRAAERIAEDNEEHQNPAPPDEDWMNFYSRFAEDASSEKLQDLFGRVLAGQIVRPGSFAVSTIRAIAELDQAIAEDFSLVWSKSVGKAVDYSPEFQRGEWFERWGRLAEAGLMAPTDVAQVPPEFRPLQDGAALWTPTIAEGVFLLLRFRENCSAHWKHIKFTRTGREIGSILARPDFISNLREAGKRLSIQDIDRVELHGPGFIENLSV
jgi:hypothetical protein